MRKNMIAVSILSANFCHLQQDITEAVAAGSKQIHIDVMDGIFVPSISFGMPVIRSIRKTVQCCFDIHLMIEQPERYIDAIADCGADLITVHAESTKHLHRVIQQIKARNLKAGIAVNPATPLEVLHYVLEDVDLVLLMTVNPGFGGQKFIPQMIDKIRMLRDKRNQLNLAFDIEVDGGINENTICEVIDAGANICVAGSAIFDRDISKSVKKLFAIMNDSKNSTSV